MSQATGMLLLLLVFGAGIIVVVLRLLRELTRLNSLFKLLETQQDKGSQFVREEIAKNRDESARELRGLRGELTQNNTAFTHSILSRITEISSLQKNQLDTFSQQLTSLTQINEQKLDKLREVVTSQLKIIQDDNSQKLEKMRETVDEKLHLTLEKRLGESFKLVSDRLEKVHQGLGEMQTLAAGVGDLKKVLSNVKTRGILGEVQLENLLEQILSPDQYVKNVVTKKGSRDPVEFAIRLPGGENEGLLLPIDAKFPMQDYERLQDAREKADLSQLEEAGKALETTIKQQAKGIKEKYLDPPYTTDFAIMFLPTEGLYAEVLGRPGLFQFLQMECKVTAAGPTTISAILSSFHMGFRTLAVQKRASEVWTLLGTIKAEYGKFGEILQKTHDKLKQATDNIVLAQKKSHTIERKLRDVQELPAGMTKELAAPLEMDVEVNEVLE
jgi:DNA recombination protein RmuC